eukprot:TRINITY_DN3160_c0_g1_i1.p1 TRINITY_DN3160_c0_g1~~TRINITY_DN3160_c0_g1_i1.p1  ORF type:complete len:828 (+),score=228.71 TRINITY_DN3160_c0_g1_i1:254-2737(+)
MDPRRRAGSGNLSGDVLPPPILRPPAGRRATARMPAGSSLAFDVDVFKGTFSFDDFFSNLVGDALPQLAEPGEGEQPDTSAPALLPGFPEAERLLPIFRDARKDLIELSRQVDARLTKLKKEVAAQDQEHKDTLSKLERGVEGLHDSFERLDTRISGVGQTAARIGDHLQSADAQRESASQTIELVKYLIEFNRGRGDLLQYSPPAAVFGDDTRLAEAAAIAQKLRGLAEEEKTSAQTPPGLEVAVANLQEYCSDLENKLLTKFDLASQRREFAKMAECAKILEQFQRGTQAIHRYVATRPMFLDVEVIQSDLRLAMGETTISSLQTTANPAKGLAILYKEIMETMQTEATTVATVFPSPRPVMKLLAQRVMMQRVQNVLDVMLAKPSLDDPPPVEQGGILQYLRTLAAAYEKTMDLAREIRNVGCGELDVEALAQRELFQDHLVDYPELEQKSLMQLFHAKYLEANQQGTAELVAGPPPTAPGGRGRTADKQAAAQQQINFGVVGDCVRWNEEAIARCKLLTPEPLELVETVQAVFGVLLDQVSVYTMLGLERAHKALNEAAALRDKFSIGTNVSRRVAAAAAQAAESAAQAGFQGIRTFLAAVKRASSHVAAVHAHFVNTVARLLLPVDGAQSRTLDELQQKMADAEAMALKGLETCIEAAMAEVERLLTSEQKAVEFKPTEEGGQADHRPTKACMQVVAYLERLLEAAQSSLEGPNRQGFLADLGIRLHKILLVHIQRYTFNLSGGLRLKRDVSEYADFLRHFKVPAVDERLEKMGTLVNLFIVAPESLPGLVGDGSNMKREEALLYVQLRDDYKSAKVHALFS